MPGPRRRLTARGRTGTCLERESEGMVVGRTSLPISLQALVLRVPAKGPQPILTRLCLICRVRWAVPRECFLLLQIAIVERLIQQLEGTGGQELGSQ